VSDQDLHRALAALHAVLADPPTALWADDEQTLRSAIAVLNRVTARKRPVGGGVV
jgi:uncharacterized protein (DUF1800 family)